MKDADDPFRPPPDRLVELQLRVARRADELVRNRGRDRAPEVLYWLRAEREILGANDPNLPGGNLPTFVAA